jgi:hypothetical protein
VDLRLAFNGPQSRAFEAFQPRARVCIPWGRGVGKSWFMRRIWYLAVAAYDGIAREGEDNGIKIQTRGVRIVHIQPTFKSCKDVHGDLTDSELGPGGDWAFLGARIDHTAWRIRFPGGSWIQWFGMREAHASRGIRCDIVTSDESDDIEMSSYDAVVAPWLTERFADEHLIRKRLLGGTPRRGRYGLLYREHRAALDGVKNHHTFHATYRDAPEVVDPAYIEEERAKLSPAVFKREYECDFDSAEGLVYGIFDPKHHVREPDSRTRWSEYLVGIDHGYEDPGVLLLAGVQGSGRDATIHLIDEVYQTKQTESWWIDAAKKLAKQYNLKTGSNPHGAQVRWFADPSRPDRIDAFGKAGIRVEQAKNAIDEGVDAVADRLVLRLDPNDKDGKRRFARLYVSPKCKETIAEFGKYRRRRDPKNPERVLDAIEDKENHCLIAGTLVTTDKGDVPIERITTGMRVLTRQGFYPVRAAGMTRENAEVWTLATSDGQTLTGTPDHLVWVEEKGWTRLCELTASHILLGSGGHSRVFAAARGLDTAAVFDLTVDGPPEFFANGVLVHNCMDSLRYLAYTRFGGPDRSRAESGPGWD